MYDVVFLNYPFILFVCVVSSSSVPAYFFVDVYFLLRQIYTFFQFCFARFDLFADWTHAWFLTLGHHLTRKLLLYKKKKSNSEPVQLVESVPSIPGERTSFSKEAIKKHLESTGVHWATTISSHMSVNLLSFQLSTRLWHYFCFWELLNLIY